MPGIVGILALCLLIAIGFIFSNSNSASRKEIEQEQALKALDDKLVAVNERLETLEKRLGNVEMIVTDAKFVDPPTSGREAINLQTEILELKNIIKNLKS